jgi:hypothetical protein
MFRVKLTTLATLAVAASGAVGASAAAASTPTRTFDVSVKGEQMTTFWEAHPKTGQCERAVNGKGSERVVFTPLRSEQIVARRYGKNFVLFGQGKLGDDEVGVRAKVTRKSVIVNGPLDPRCEGTGGNTTPPPPPDCGTKRTQFDVSLGWSPAAPSRGITLDTGSLIPPGELFHNCGVIGITFPTLLTDNTSQRPIVARIPAGDLFDPAFKKHIVIASGRFVSNTVGSGYTTWIRWTVSLTEHRK